MHYLHPVHYHHHNYLTMCPTYQMAHEQQQQQQQEQYNRRPSFNDEVTRARSLSTSSQMTVPESPSLVRVRSWYTVTKQGFS